MVEHRRRRASRWLAGGVAAAALAAAVIGVGLSQAAPDDPSWPPPDTAKNTPAPRAVPTEEFGPYKGTPKNQIPNKENGRPGPVERSRPPVGDRPSGEVLKRLQREVEGRNDQWICYDEAGRYVTSMTVALLDPGVKLTREYRDDQCRKNGAARSVPNA